MDEALKKELRQRAAEDDRLYDQFGVSLEATHRGQYIAIGRTGEFLAGPDDIAVLDHAITKFGRGNFAFRRIGDRTLGRLQPLVQARITCLGTEKILGRAVVDRFSVTFDHGQHIIAAE